MKFQIKPRTKRTHHKQHVPYNSESEQELLNRLDMDNILEDRDNIDDDDDKTMQSQPCDHMAMTPQVKSSYICPGCGEKVDTVIDSLIVHCNDCGVDMDLNYVVGYNACIDDAETKHQINIDSMQQQIDILKNRPIVYSSHKNEDYVGCSNVGKSNHECKCDKFHIQHGRINSKIIYWLVCDKCYVKTEINFK